MLCNIKNMFSKPSGLGTMKEERNRERGKEKGRREEGGKKERREEKMEGRKEKNRKNSLDKK